MDPLGIAHHLAAAAFDAWIDIEGRPGLHEPVSMGADGSLTSRADAALDAAILEAAAQLGISVLSEEAGFVDHGSEWTAVVDPLDGSRNAGRGIPFHCTSIAVGKDDLLHVEAGVVKNLVTADTYTSQLGKGAYLNGEIVRGPDFDPEDVLVAVIADSSMDEVKQEQERRGHHLRDLGSAALELCLVGTGGLDAFLVRQPWLRVIDIAAGTLFVREAGGTVESPQGGDLATPFDLDARTGLIAARCAGAREAVL